MSRLRRVGVVFAIGLACVALGALVYLGLRREEVFVCRTCTAERVQATLKIFGGTLEERTTPSKLADFARERFDIRHEHRWTSQEELRQLTAAMRTGKKTFILRPSHDAAVIEVAKKLEAYRAHLGRVFLQTWLEPDDKTETDFKTAYLSVLVTELGRLTRTDPDRALGAYAPLIMFSSLNKEDQDRLEALVRARLR